MYVRYIIIVILHQSQVSSLYKSCEIWVCSSF